MFQNKSNLNRHKYYSLQRTNGSTQLNAVSSSRPCPSYPVVTSRPLVTRVTRGNLKWVRQVNTGNTGRGRRNLLGSKNHLGLPRSRRASHWCLIPRRCKQTTLHAPIRIKCVTKERANDCGINDGKATTKDVAFSHVTWLVVAQADDGPALNRSCYRLDLYGTLISWIKTLQKLDRIKMSSVFVWKIHGVSVLYEDIIFYMKYCWLGMTNDCYSTRVHRKRHM